MQFLLVIGELDGLLIRHRNRCERSAVASASASLVQSPFKCRNIKAKDKYATLEGATTLYESFKRTVHEYPTEEFIAERRMVNGRAGPYEFQTFKQVEGDHLAVLLLVPIFQMDPDVRRMRS